MFIQKSIYLHMYVNYLKLLNLFSLIKILVKLNLKYKSQINYFYVDFISLLRKCNQN